MRNTDEKSSVLMIGVGNPYRNDDGAGHAVIERLKSTDLAGVDYVEAVGEGAALMELWKNHKRVILVDAVHSGERPGTIHRFHANVKKIPSQFFHYSTHAFSVAEAVELARSLGQLPDTLIVYGIEGKNFDSGTKLSRDVEKASKELSDHLEREIRALPLKK